MDKLALQTAISHFLAYTNTHSSPANAASTRQALTTFTRFLTARASQTSSISSLSFTPEEFHEFHEYLQREYSPETEHAYLRAVIAFAAFSQVPPNTLLEFDESVRISRRKKEKHDPEIPFDSVAAVRSYLEQAPVPVPDPNLAVQRDRLRVLRDKALIFTVLDSGLKPSETTTLRVSQFNPHNAALTLQTTQLPLQGVTANALTAYLAERSPLDKAQTSLPGEMLPLFARHDKRASDRILPISRWTVGNIVSEWTRLATPTPSGTGNPLTPSLLRHHFVAATLASTADIELTQSRARHKDRGTTRHYLTRNKSKPQE